MPGRRRAGARCRWRAASRPLIGRSSTPRRTRRPSSRRSRRGSMPCVRPSGRPNSSGSRRSSIRATRGGCSATSLTWRRRCARGGPSASACAPRDNGNRRSAMARIYEGLKVVDLSRVLAGPFCAQMLADMGADVIKIEAPEGDENRRWPPLMPNGLSSNYASVNRGKRAITLNMKSPRAAEVLDRLVRRADVVLHSFLPATAARLGISYERFHAINPRLVFCSITGYGERGDLANKPGYDLMVQAFAGPMSVTGYEEGPPVRTGVSFVDMATGMSAYGAIASALYARERTGRGNWVRASLLETAVSILGYHGIAWLQAGVMPRKEGSGGANQAPYQAFHCSDGF